MKNLLLVSWSVVLIFRVYFAYFCSDLCYFLSSAYFGLYFSLSVSFRYMVYLGFFFFMTQTYYNFPRRSAVAASQGFGVIVFLFSFVPRYLLISSFIWFLTHVLFSSTLFSLRVFFLLLLISSHNWFLILYHCDQRKWLIWFQVFKLYWDLFCGLPWSILENVPCALEGNKCMFCCFGVKCSKNINWSCMV